VGLLPVAGLNGGTPGSDMPLSPTYVIHHFRVTLPRVLLAYGPDFSGAVMAGVGVAQSGYQMDPEWRSLPMSEARDCVYPVSTETHRETNSGGLPPWTMTPF